MSTKNYSIHTKKYRALISTIHSIYRLFNSTYELKDLTSRLCRLICQIFNAESCMILLLDPSKKYSILKCGVDEKKRYIIEKKLKIKDRLEKRIIKTLATVREDHILGLPLISEDVIGVMIAGRDKKKASFDAFDQEILMTALEQAVIGIKNMQLYDEQQKVVMGSIKSLVTLLDARVPQEYSHSPYFSKLATSIGELIFAS